MEQTIENDPTRHLRDSKKTMGKREEDVGWNSRRHEKQTT